MRKGEGRKAKKGPKNRSWFPPSCLRTRLPRLLCLGRWLYQVGVEGILICYVYPRKLTGHGHRLITRTLCDRFGAQRIDFIVAKDETSPFGRLVMPTAGPIQ